MGAILPYVSILVHYSMHPVIHWMILVLCLMIMNKRWNKWVLGLIGLCYIIVVAWSPIPALLLKNLENAYPAQVDPVPERVGVVLGGDTIRWDHEKNQFMFRSNAERVFSAAWLYRSGKIKTIHFTGTSYESSHLWSEAKSVQKFLVEQGVPESAITVEINSKNTYENIKNLKTYFQTDPLEGFLLITSASHMKRSMYLCNKFKLKARAYPVDYSFDSSLTQPLSFMENLNIWWKFLHEFVGELGSVIL